MAIKNTVSIVYDLRSSIVVAFWIAAYPVCESTIKFNLHNQGVNASYYGSLHLSG